MWKYWWMNPFNDTCCVFCCVFCLYTWLPSFMFDWGKAQQNVMPRLQGLRSQRFPSLQRKPTRHPSRWRQQLQQAPDLKNRRQRHRPREVQQQSTRRRHQTRNPPKSRESRKWVLGAKLRQHLCAKCVALSARALKRASSVSTVSSLVADFSVTKGWPRFWIQLRILPMWKPNPLSHDKVEGRSLLRKANTRATKLFRAIGHSMFSTNSYIYIYIII